MYELSNAHLILHKCMNSPTPSKKNNTQKKQYKQTDDNLFCTFWPVWLKSHFE